MLWPFKTKEKQRKFGLVSGFLGVFILLFNTTFNLPLIDITISTFYTGSFIGLIGVMYFIEA